MEACSLFQAVILCVTPSFTPFLSASFTPSPGHYVSVKKGGEDRKKETIALCSPCRAQRKVKSALNLKAEGAFSFSQKYS